MDIKKITSAGKVVLKNYLLDILQKQELPEEIYIKKKRNEIQKLFLRKKYLKFEQEGNTSNNGVWIKYTEDIEIIELAGLQLEERISRSENYSKRIDALYNIVDCQNEDDMDSLYKKYIESLKDEVVSIYEKEIAICKQQLIIDKFKQELTRERIDQIRDLLGNDEQELSLLKTILKDDCLTELKAVSIKELSNYNATSLLNYIYFDLHRSKIYK